MKICPIRLSFGVSFSQDNKISMSPFEGARPPDPQMKQAEKTMEEADADLFSSRDPTGQSLAKALAMLRQRSSILAVTRDNTTSAEDRFRCSRVLCSVCGRVMAWLQGHRRMLKDAVCAIYPGFIEQIEAEDQDERAVENSGRVTWRYEQQSCDLPNLLRDFLHCG